VGGVLEKEPADAASCAVGNMDRSIDAVENSDAVVGYLGDAYAPADSVEELLALPHVAGCSAAILAYAFVVADSVVAVVHAVVAHAVVVPAVVAPVAAAAAAAVR